MIDAKPDENDLSPIQLAAALARGESTWENLSQAAKFIRDADTIITGCRDLIATQRTRIAEAEQELSEVKKACGYSDVRADYGLTLAAHVATQLGMARTQDVEDIIVLGKRVRAAEQENARLREGIRELTTNKGGPDD